MEVFGGLTLLPLITKKDRSIGGQCVDAISRGVKCDALLLLAYAEGFPIMRVHFALF